MTEDKNTAIAVSILLIITMAIALFPLNIVAGQDTRSTNAFIGATPNPVGVGQETLLHIGIMQQLSSTAQGWDDITVTVKHPDGSTETLGPFHTDATGGTGYSFTPQQEGEYILQTHFPQQDTSSNKVPPGSSVGTVMLASDSPELTLVVTSEPTPVYPPNPLPTEYWTRPIDAQLREWSSIAGSQLESGGYGGDIKLGNYDAPETAHILWRQTLQLGGLAGGALGNAGTYTGDAYEGKFSSSLIIQGVLIYRKFDTIGGSEVDNWLVAVDIHTGEKLWEKELFAYDDPTDARVYPTFGQIFYWDSFNAHGTHPYLVCSSGGGGFFAPAPAQWHFFDPLTARWLFTWENVPSGTRLRGPHGEIIIYEVSLGANTIRMWNSSAVIDAYWGTSVDNPAWGSWRPQGKITDATGECPVTYATPLGLNGYQWEATISGDLTGSISAYALEDKFVGYDWEYESSYFGGTIGITEITVWGVSLKPGSIGQVLFEETWNAPSSWAEGDVSTSLSATSIEDGAMIFWSKEDTNHVAFSTDTGKYIWGPTESQDYLDYLGHRTLIGEGRYFSLGMSGILHCYNVTTGDLLWTYEADDPYNQVLWSNQWHIRPLMLTDGKFYMGTTEHSPVDPLTRGGPFCAVDIETGEEVFRADGLFRQTDWGGRAIIGDSIIATMDTYDLQVYGIGKGPTRTTLTAPDNGVPFGESVMIRGTVTDISPGTDNIGVAKRFPNGVSAVSDANQSGWMRYVYKQFEYAPHETWIGVPVTLYVVDSNMNAREIGTATTSAENGAFAFAWTPDIPGTFYLYAEFQGSAAYYGSHAETAFVVDPAPEPTMAPTPQPESPTDAYVLGMGGAAVAAIVIIGFIIILMLRRQ
jgi:outer membrane protein assembly factor BamB